MATNLRLTRGAIVSERVNAVLAPLLGKGNAKRLLAEATVAAERDGADLADVLAVALEQAGVAGPTCPGCSTRPATPGCPVRWSTGCSRASTMFCREGEFA